MRYFFLLSILISSSAFAQVCDENTNYGAGGVINCPNGMNVNGALTNPLGNATIEIQVTGDVFISSSTTFNLNGAPGFNVLNTASDSIGGVGGPGAGDGGGILGNAPTDATDTALPGSNANGKSAQFNTAGACGGGGGGGMALIGTHGEACAGTDGLPGIDSAAVIAAEFGFDANFRGGFGGGAGGEAGGEFALGGGGGGAIKIIATGNVTINGKILARGGNGGTSPNGGGGGGGSGGAIWIEADGNLIIGSSAQLLAQGGAGGEGEANGSAGDGGAGSKGFIRLRSLGIFHNGGTISDTSDIPNSVALASSSNALKSDISCGMIKPNENHHSSLMQMFFMMMTVIGFGYLRRLKIFR